MKISVIIPAHNATAWIGAALASVASQTHPPLEVIVVDDSSSDDLAGAIASSGVDVRLLSTRARNAAVARNVGIEAARGDWIALLDADDIWYPEHLARAVDLLAGTADVAFMASHDWMACDGRRVAMPAAHRCGLVEPRVCIPSTAFFGIVSGGFHFGHSTVLYERRRVLDVGLFEPTQVRRHDIDLWLRVIAAHTWTYDTHPHAAYRVDTPASLSKAALECDYFYLRALHRNRLQYRSPDFDRYMRRQSRRAIGIAFGHGLDAHYARLRELAFGELPVGLRWAYRLAERCPGAARAALAAKRRLLACGPRWRPARQRSSAEASG